MDINLIIITMPANAINTKDLKLIQYDYTVLRHITLVITINGKHMCIVKYANFLMPTFGLGRSQMCPNMLFH